MKNEYIFHKDLYKIIFRSINNPKPTNNKQVHSEAIDKLWYVYEVKYYLEIKSKELWYR